MFDAPGEKHGATSPTPFTDADPLAPWNLAFIEGTVEELTADIEIFAMLCVSSSGGSCPDPLVIRDQLRAAVVIPLPPAFALFAGAIAIALSFAGASHRAPVAACAEKIV